MITEVRSYSLLTRWIVPRGAATRSGAVAANNIVNAAFQVGGTLLAGSAVAAGVPIVVVLAASGASALLVVPLLRRL